MLIEKVSMSMSSTWYIAVQGTYSKQHLESQLWNLQENTKCSASVLPVCTEVCVGGAQSQNNESILGPALLFLATRVIYTDYALLKMRNVGFETRR